ncbi:thioredoxin domain-containing protein [Candidatus Woesebacteria bacterium]|nr:thioredoxin domain-containing protein [Candidatus Woesebacteria bacterium]
MDKKTLITAAGSIVGIIVFLVVAYLLTSKPQTTFFAELQKPSDTDHVKWASDGKITMVEYSDFQCPACGQYFPLIKQIENDPELGPHLKKEVTFVYRELPLESIHHNARDAARAAEAAGKQNAFFGMHDLLFTNQSEWSNNADHIELFKKYAQELNLDIDQFTADMQDKTIDKKIDNDVASADQFGVQATPTFFLNGKKVINFQTAEQLKAIILDELNAQ